MIFVEFENMNGVKMNPFNDFELVLSSHSVSPPKPKLYRVDIDGADGSLDLSEWAGEIKYENREVELVFTCAALKENHDAMLDGFKAFILGRMQKLTFLNEPEYYYKGRVDEIKVETSKGISSITVTMTCQPYKLAHKESVLKFDVVGTMDIVLKSKRKTVIPTITTTATSITLTYKNNSYTVAAGTRQIAGITVTDSPEVLTVNGDTTITLTWLEGVL